jgi:phytoene/squalene synthetase
MSRIDYAKWNNLDDSDDDTSDKKTAFDLLLQWKRAADNLFERGENENDIDHYKNAQIL